MITKTIHYVWFGNEKPNLIKKCIKSWNEKLPDYEIIEWNENNFNVHEHPFTKKAYNEKKWAFLSDFIRLYVIYKHGGIYLDTDVEILKSFDPLLENNFFIGIEMDKIINVAVLGANNKHWLVKEILNEYEDLTEYEPIPKIATRVISKHIEITGNKQIISNGDIIFPPEYFYPFSYEEKFSPECITENTYCIHWWADSWGSKKIKILKKIGLLKTAVKVKKFIKRFFD